MNEELLSFYFFLSFYFWQIWIFNEKNIWTERTGDSIKKKYSFKGKIEKIFEFIEGIEKFMGSGIEISKGSLQNQEDELEETMLFKKC